MSVEDRFWHLQPGAGSLMSDEDEEALLVRPPALQAQRCSEQCGQAPMGGGPVQARAMEESMRECSRQAQLHSGMATAHAGHETRLDELIPNGMRNISQEWGPSPRAQACEKWRRPMSAVLC